MLKPILWTWQGHTIPYVQAGAGETAIVLIHGFGANLGHWRKNIPTLAQKHRVYALDLLGFGGAAKPRGDHYTFEHWGQQVADFLEQVVQTPAFLVGNSIGCIVALQTALQVPNRISGVTLINCSLRLLHQRKRQTLPWFRQLGTPLLQRILAYEPLGQLFFDRLRTPQTIRKILQQAYRDHTAISDELIELLLSPSADPGALGVFLAFIRYDTGPLAEDLLPLLTVPVQILWGDQDPWEPIALGRVYADYPMVREFKPIPGAGHCPQDEAPELVNALLLQWVADLDLNVHPLPSV